MTTQRPFAHWQQVIQQRKISTEKPLVDSFLPPVFQFSQNNLQDYIDCARRFQLRYVLGQKWPAVESEPMEEHEHLVEQGTQFHLLVQRHLLGIPEEKLTPEDPTLRSWWEAYLHFSPSGLPDAIRLPEAGLSVPMGDQRILARFDLLAADPGQRVVILDWKTTRRRPSRSVLSARLQTRVYPFVLTEAGSEIVGSPVPPEQVSLVYWFAVSPQDPEVFAYSTDHHEDNRAYLSGLIGRITRHHEDVWPLTDDLKICQFCVYRSLCGRGVKAGDYNEWPSEGDLSDFDIDLDNVEEIAF